MGPWSLTKKRPRESREALFYVRYFSRLLLPLSSKILTNDKCCKDIGITRRKNGKTAREISIDHEKPGISFGGLTEQVVQLDGGLQGRVAGREELGSRTARAGGRSDFDDRVWQRAHGADEKFHNGSVKLRIRAALQLGERVRRSPGLLVRAIAGDGIVGVGNRDDAGAQWHSFSRQRLRITRAVEEFVVVQNHVAEARKRRQRVEDLDAKLYVRLHRLPLFRLERAVLVQNTFRNANLADVVEHRAQTNLFHFGIFQPHGFRDQGGIRGDFL